MAFIPFPLCAQFQANFLIAGQNCQLTFTLRKGSDFDATTLAQANTIIRDWVNNSYRTYISNGAALTQVAGQDLSNQSGPNVIRPESPFLLGTVASPVVANNSTIVTGLKSDQRGRSHRGRKYNVGLPQNAYANAVSILPSYAVSLMGSYQSLTLALGAAGIDLVIPSRRANGADRLSGVVTKVTGFYMDLALDSMRRRLLGRGL